MALQSYTLTLGAQVDADNNGKNYVPNEAVFIKNKNGSLALIYRDELGTSLITQDGLANKTNSAGQFEFFIETGNYTAEYKTQSTNISIYGADYFDSQIDYAINKITIETGYSRGYNRKGTFASGFTYELPNDVGVDTDGNAWVYTDIDELPSAVTAGTVPSEPEYSPVFLSESDNVKNSDGSSSQNTHDATKAILKSQGLSGGFGFFADGFTYVDAGDVGIDANNKMWIYVGAGAPSKDVAAGTNPEGSLEYLVVSTEISIDSTALISKSSFSVGDKVNTAGFSVKGDGGKASYQALPPGSLTNGANGRHLGYDYFEDTNGNQLSLSHSGVVFPEQFGWVGDWVLYPQEYDNSGATDNTLAINNMISYCSPYEWEGNVLDTKIGMGNLRAKIVGGTGTAMVTDSILINPFVKWEGLKKGGFTNATGGTLIVGNFDSNSKYVLDTAPMDNTGNRPLGSTYNRVAWDSGVNSGCPGFSIDSIGFAAAKSRVIKGAFNRQIAIQSSVKNCSFGANGGGKVYEGVKTSCSWGGNLSDNHIIAAVYCLRNDVDVTTDYQHNNYCTISGSKPTNAEYSFVSWGGGKIAEKSVCIINNYADPHLDSNTCEGGQVGVASINSNFLREYNGYYEAISEYIYATNSVSSDLKPKWCIASGATLVSVEGGSQVRSFVDLTACSYFNVASLASVSSFSKGVSLTGSPIAYDTPFNSRVDYSDAEFNGVVEIFVDNGGNDSNTGYTLSNAVLTVQEALLRCKKGLRNKIIFTIGQSHQTKYALGSSNVTSSQPLEGFDIEFSGGGTIVVGSSSNQTHCLPLSSSSLIVGGVDIDISGGAGTGNYRPFVRARGEVSFKSSSNTISGGALIGTQFGSSGSASISLNSVTLGAGSVLTDNGSESGSFVWIESSRNVTNGATVGTGVDGRIISKLFP